MDVGKKIKDARLKKGLTQTQLGDRVGVTKSAVMKWEKGIVENIKRSMILKLSDTLDISPLDVLGIEVTPSKQPNLSDLLYGNEVLLLEDFRLLNAAGQKAVAKVVKSFTTDPDYSDKAKKIETSQPDTKKAAPAS